jgi:hypothetical protein
VSATSTIVRLRPIASASRPPVNAPTTEPATTIVATHSVWCVVRSKSLVMNSSAPAIAPRS